MCDLMFDVAGIETGVAHHNGREIWTTTDELSRITGLHPVQLKVGLSELERAGMLEHLGDEGYRILFRKSEWNPKEIDKAAANSKEHIRHRQTQLDGILQRLFSRKLTLASLSYQHWLVL